MPETETLISQALALVEESRPISFGDAIPMSMNQSLVFAVHGAVEARNRGYGSDAEVDKAMKLARRGKIPETEIHAAVEAAESSGLTS
jgi:hypothetical protein